ncbi:tetratricopeptide repeat protein [Geotalea toluenoxydans]
MASNREKLLESAQKFILKGQLDRAIKDYQQVVALDPKDTRHRQRLAELLVRSGRNDEAVTEYEVIGKFYDDNGYYLKAIAVYKQIQKLTPDNIKITVILAALNGKQGLTGNALDEYRTAVNFFEKNSQLADAVKTVEKMLELDPENLATCQKHAELLFARREPDAAFDAYTRLTNLLKTTGNQSAAEKMEARIANLFPDRAKLSVEDLAVLVKSDVDNAIGKLSGLIKQDSTNLPLWKLLIQAYQVKEDHEKLRLTYDLIIRLFPDELFAREGIIRSAMAEQKYAEGVELLGKHSGFFLAQSAFGTLEALYMALREWSDDGRIVSGLKELYQKSGEAEKLTLLENSIQQVEPQPEETFPLEEEAAESAIGCMENPGIESMPAGPAESSDFVVTAEASEIECGGDWEEDIYLSIDDGEDVAAELAALEEDALPSEDDILSAGEELLPGEEDLTSAAEEIDHSDQDVLAIDEDVLLSEEVPFDGKTEAETLNLAEEEFSAVDVVLDEPEMELSAEICEVVDDAESLSLELAEELGEPEELHGVSDAGNLLELDSTGLTEHEHLVLLPEEAEDLPELSLLDIEDELPDGEQDKFGIDISKGIDQLFDEFEESLTLAEEPAVSVKAAKYSWDGMLTEADEQTNQGDAETHFDLGIAYKEMGLYDDAIGEFRRASASPKRKLDCASLQAACYREKNDFEQAEKMLLEAMSLEEATDEDMLGLKYELALLCETSGRSSEALDIYKEVKKVNPDFPGVALKIASLEGGPDSLELMELDYEELEELVETPESGSQ